MKSHSSEGRFVEKLELNKVTEESVSEGQYEDFLSLFLS